MSAVTVTPPRRGAAGTFDPAPLLAMFTVDELVEHGGVDRSTVNYWKKGTHRVRFFTADRVCTALHTHVALVWPDYPDRAWR